MGVYRHIQDYQSRIVGRFPRHDSWQHCYEYFQGGRARSKDHANAALQLAFFLASWGMYRGRSFLLQHSYEIHLGAVAIISRPRFDELWDRDFGARKDHERLIARAIELAEALRHTYEPFLSARGDHRKGAASDTLVTKVILGTFGCLPACDRFFRDGFRICGLRYSSVNTAFVTCVLDFCREHLAELRKAQEAIRTRCGVRYPLMKLVDMYFWEIGRKAAEE